VLWILAGVSIALLAYEGSTLVTAVLLPLWHNPNAIQTDFHYYYEAARRFAQDRQWLYMASDHVIAGFAYPPPAIVPFVVLAKLRLGTAFPLLTLASYAALAAAILQWCRFLRRSGATVDARTTTAILLVVMALGPTYMNAIFGQVNAFILATCVAFVVLGETKPAIAGLLLAGGIWLKIYPVLLGVRALFDPRQWRSVAWAGVAAVAILIVVLPIVPLPAYRTFFLDVLPVRLDKTAIHITNQSLAAFLERFWYPPELFLNWTGQQAVTMSLAVRSINMAMTLTALVALWRLTAAGRLWQPAGAAILMALVAVVAPLGWGHTYVMVLPLIVLRLIEMRHARPLIAALIAVCVAAFMLPAGRHLPIDAAPSWMQNLAYSRYLIATTVLMVISSTRIGPVTPAPVISSA
jgi:alpha-1,2-mannosyltransferase